jgi:hypothetical protein
MKQFVRRTQKISFGVIIAIFVASFFTSLVPVQSVFAAPADDSSNNPNDWFPETRAKRWAIMNGLYSCQQEAWGGANEWVDGFNNDRIEQKNATSGKWFYDPPSGGLDAPSQPAGYIDVDLKGGEKGFADCNSVPSAAASAYGLNLIQLLCKMGGSREDGSPCESSGSGSKFKPPDSGDRMDMTEFWGSKSLPDSAGGAAYYALNLAALMSNEGCSLKADSGASGDFAYELKIVGDDGSITTEKFTGQKRDHEVNVYSSIGLNDQKRKCSQLQSDLEKYSGDYASWVRDHQESVDEIGKGGEEEAVESSCAIDGVGWIVCPVMIFVGKMNDAAFGFLEEILGIRPAVVTSESTQAAWAAFRDIANVAFVIAFMVIVYSQITSAGISNYGIKKMLPRIVIAAILVNVSFIICAIAVDLSNIVGASVYSLFQNSIAPDVGSDITNASWEEQIAGALAMATAIGVILIVVLLFIGPMALLALGMIILILVARQALVILLIVVAPLAFVAYLLPNTEDWFKKWYKAFIAVLMVYPIVGAVFGVSTLASRVLSSVAADTEDSSLLQVIALGVLAVPLFAVPAILKGSLSAAGSIGARLSNLSDRANRAATKTASSRADRIGKDVGNRFKIAAQDPENKWGRRLGGYSRWKNNRNIGMKDRESAANRSAELGYATSMIEKDANGEFTERALRMQRAAAGGVGAATKKGQVRAKALATQRTFKQFDDDVSAFQTTQTSDRQTDLIAKQNDTSLSVEERAAAAGTIASRSYRKGHNESLKEMHAQMGQADSEFLAAQQAVEATTEGTAERRQAEQALSAASSKVADVEAIQKQFNAQWKDKSFGMSDGAMGELGEGIYGRANVQYDDAGNVKVENGQVVRKTVADIYTDTMVRSETKLNEQTLVTMNPDDLTIIHDGALAAPGSAEALTDDQLREVATRIVSARGNKETSKLIKKEANEKFDRILAKAVERGLVPAPAASAETGPAPLPEDTGSNSGSIISGGPDGLR